MTFAFMFGAVQSVFLNDRKSRPIVMGRRNVDVKQKRRSVNEHRFVEKKATGRKSKEETDETDREESESPIASAESLIQQQLSNKLKKID